MVLIFDMDGVIVDNHKYHFEAWFEFGKKHGINISREEFGRHFGSTNKMIMTSLLGDDISDERIFELAREKEAMYREIYRPFIKPVSGLPEFLHYASEKGIPIALATSAPSENVKFTLEETGIEKYFSLITDSSMISRGKPDPEVYLVTAEKLGVLPSDCIVFEDAVPGIISAKTAGMRVIGVATTHKSEELLMYVNEIIMNFEAPHKLMEKLLRPTALK